MLVLKVLLVAAATAAAKPPAAKPPGLVSQLKDAIDAGKGGARKAYTSFRANQERRKRLRVHGVGHGLHLLPPRLQRLEPRHLDGDEARRVGVARVRPLPERRVRVAEVLTTLLREGRRVRRPHLACAGWEGEAA